MVQLTYYIKLNAFEGYCKSVLDLMRFERSLFRESTVTVETLERIELLSKHETKLSSYYAFHGFRGNSGFSDWWI